MPAGDRPPVTAPPPQVAAERPEPQRHARLRYLGLLALTLVVAVWGAFLVPVRIAGVAVPVGWLLAAAVPLLVRRAGRLVGTRAAAAGPLLVWTAVAFALSTQRREGDVVITGSLRGLLFLVIGLLGGAAAVGLQHPATRPTD